MPKMPILAILRLLWPPVRGPWQKKRGPWSAFRHPGGRSL